jgi:site-specific DNA-cytosine methylase
MTGVVLFAGGGLACHGLVEAGLDLELGVDRQLSRLLALAVLDADKESS